MKNLFILFLLFIFHSLSLGFKVAIVMGHNDGGQGVSKLNFAEQDARKFSQILQEIAGFQKENIHLVLQPDSLTLAGVLEKVQQNFKAASTTEQQNMLVMYYSGHANDKGLNLAEESFSLENIKAYIRGFPADIRIGIFDACQSGALTQFKGATEGKPFYLQPQKDVRGQVIIASSAATELAQESEALKSSVFSHHWFNGLRGSADGSGDNQVTLSEAYHYAYRKTVETTALTGGGIQHPSYQFKIFGEGEIVLTDLRRAKNGILLPKEFSGTHLILSENYSDVFADFHKKKGHELFLPLAPGSYTIIQSQKGEARLHTFEITSQQIYHIKQSSLKLNPVHWNKVKGSQPLAEKIEKEVVTAPLSSWSYKVGGGLSYALQDPSWGPEEKLYSCNVSAKYYLSPAVDLRMGGGMFFSGLHYQMEGGFEQKFLNENNKLFPFVYYGTGFDVYNRETSSYAKSAGFSFVGALGLSLRLSPTLIGSLQIPYRFVTNKHYDQIVGVELSLEFLSKYRNVNKLVY